MQPSNKSSSVLPTVLSALGGAALSSFFGVDHHLFFGALLGALIGQVWSLRHRVRDLHGRLQTMESVVVRRDVVAAQPVSANNSAPTGEPTTATPTQPGELGATLAASQSHAVTGRTSSSQATQTSASNNRGWPQPRAWELRLHAGIEWLKTRNPIALAAVAISFLGGVFLVKYAAEHTHFPIEYRFIALGSVTIAAVLLGWRLHARNAVFAQILQGGGVAGLYLTLFSATRMYALLPPSLTFGLMIGVAVAAAILAVAQNALPLAVIGSVGGFITPLLLATDTGNHIALFTYYAILNLGIFAVAWFRTWRLLNVLGFAFTFSITAVWRAGSYAAPQLLSTELFLALFFLMYVSVSILNALRQPIDLKGYVSGSLVFGLPVVAFSLHASLIRPVPYALAYSALGMALFYCLLAWLLHQSRHNYFRLLVEAFAALSVIFASLAIPLVFDQYVTAAMWSIEGAGLMWLGLRQQRKLPRGFAVLLQLSAGVSYVMALAFSVNAAASQWTVVNGIYIGSVLLAIAAAFSAWQLHLHRAVLARYEQAWSSIALFVACAWWLLGGLEEINRHFGGAQVGATLIYLAITTAVLWLLAQRWPWSLPRALALLAPTLASFIAVVQLGADSTVMHPFKAWGMLGWPVLFATQYWLLRRSDELNDAAQASENELATLLALDNVLHPLMYVWLAVIASWELAWQAQHLLGGVWSWLPLGLIPAALLWCGVQPRVTLRWPLLRHATSYRLHAGLALAVLLSLWLLGINLTSAGQPVFIAYVPLLNPQDISCVLVGLALVQWWLALTEQERAAAWPTADLNPLLVLAALAFIWANSALVRTLHYLFGVPLNGELLFHSTLVQASLSVFWMMLALVAMLAASRRALRVLWLSGAGLMSVVIIKLLLIDLSNTGTLARIISFLTVGGLLFVVSYLSPLPPAPKPRNSVE
jgi:uncharacterized membrane protein